MLLFGIILCFLPLPSIWAETCNADGQCINSTLLKILTASNSTECLDDCKDYDGCNWFSYQPQGKLCELFANCNEISVDDCLDCVTGEVTCDDLQCNIPGQCQVS